MDYLILAQGIVTEPSNLKIYAYVGFIALVLVFLALDLGVFHREAHEVSMKEAVTWSVVWLTFGLSFTAFIYFAYDNQWLGLGVDTPIYNPDATGPGDLIITGTVSGATAATHYLTGYVVEKSLAMDNIFVIAMVFGFFAIPSKYQHRVLFWGIIGALLMRGVMILVGGELIKQYQWILILFGAFLLLSALKMAVLNHESDPSKNIIVRMTRRMFPVTNVYHGQQFFVRVDPEELKLASVDERGLARDVGNAGALPGTRTVLAMTPLFLALIMVEITDLVFAVDSIPAIFAITPDPFIVFTSNIFAILGLRALYFCLAVLIAKFRYLKPALILILAFVGVKLLLMSVPPYLNVIGLESAESIKIGPMYSLAVVVLLLAGAVVLSIVRPAKPVAVAADSVHSGSH
jgi:tellurite resistance protein TerC